MFEGFAPFRLATAGARIAGVRGGSGPPLLLLHGYPQTHAMWHRVAPRLAGRFTVVCPDLRGYGASSTPEPSADHAAMSKRAMARDMVEVMAALGFDRFAVAAHDRGARVAHRMMLDHEEAVSRAALLDIAPTREMYRDAGSAFAHAYWHWYWLTLPHPWPETMIGADPRDWLRRKLGSGSAGLAPFAPEALAAYEAAFTPAAIAASCEDYRAAATLDLAHDDADGGRRVAQPLLVLWGRHGVIERCFDALALWRERAADVRGEALEAGHYLAEEAPDAVADRLLAWFGED